MSKFVKIDMCADCKNMHYNGNTPYCSVDDDMRLVDEGNIAPFCKLPEKCPECGCSWIEDTD